MFDSSTMTKLLIKINELSPTIIALIDKIQLLESQFLTKEQKLQCTKEMLDLVEGFKDFFINAVKISNNDNELKVFKQKVERAFSQFNWDSYVAIAPYEFKKFSENGKCLISSILKLLGAKGCGILIVETYLKLCTKITTTMRDKIDNYDTSEEKLNFKLLLEGFHSAASILCKYWHIAFLENQKSGIILCFNQICKILPFLLKMIKVQNLYLKKYSLDLLIKCLMKILDEIHCNGSLQTNDCGQEFIRLMDFCLYKLNELPSCTDEFTSFVEKARALSACLKSAIDEILFYVMSIAQVTSFDTDNAEIMAASQKVLREFNELKSEIEKENCNEIKLNASGLGESLCSLEQKVNIAVLRLVLEVFSGVNSPLKNIVNKCRTDIAKDNKTSDDLLALISNFDSEMDRVMQIGLFAVSCTTSLNRILKIRSCLASLESLETELIPSLTALYLDCTATNKANFQYLMDFWLGEITELKILIDSIIDPAGFCGVVKGQIQSLMVTLKKDESFPDVSLNKVNYTLEHIIKYSRKLLKTLKTSLDDENEIDEKLMDYLKKLQLAVQECEAVLDLLGKDEDTKRVFDQTIRRCDFLLNTLDELAVHLFTLTAEADLEESGKEHLPEKTKFQIPTQNYYKLYEPSIVSPTPATVPEILTPYVNTAILRSKRRNILYTSPLQIEETTEDNNEEALQQTRHWDKTPISRKRSRCCKPLTLNLELGNTIDLEISTILENVSEINKTSFNENKKMQTKETPGKVETVKTKKDVACGVRKRFTTVTYKSSGCCAKLDSEENEKGSKGEEDREGDDNFIGSRMRNRLFQSLNDLSHNSLLLVEDSNEGVSSIDTLDRENDLKMVEEKINFLKEQVPCMLP